MVYVINVINVKNIVCVKKKNYIKKEKEKKNKI